MREFRTANRLYDALETLPQIVIELALACDIRLAAAHRGGRPPRFTGR
jgi:hypothetical protein